MNLGIPTLMEFSDINELARFCSDHGFGFIEMNMTFPWFQMNAVNPDCLQKLKKQYGIALTIHLHDQVNPFEFSPEMRKGSIENIRFAIKLAEALSINKLTMHLQPGTYSSVNGKKKYLYEHCKDHYLELVLTFRSFVDEMLQGKDVSICIENTSGFLPVQKEAIELMLQSEHFGLTFDIGHNYKAGGGDESFILMHDNKLKHFHIHDCSIKSNHLAFGAGGLDLPRYLKMAEYYGCSAVAEVKESSALLRSKEYLVNHSLW